MFVGLYFGLIIKKNMRNILFTLMISISLFSCNMDNDYYVIEKHENKIVKSVIYRLSVLLEFLNGVLIFLNFKFIKMESN